MPAAKFQPLATPRLTLRRFATHDLAAFLAYRNDPEVARYQGWETISVWEARVFIEEQQSQEPGGSNSLFQVAFARKDTDELIGDGMLHVKTDDRLGEIGYTIAPASQRQGYATEAVQAMVAYAFGTLRLHRIMAVADCRNLPSIRLLERLGMRREGHFLQHAWYKGEWCDEYQYAILHDEWAARVEKPQV